MKSLRSKVFIRRGTATTWPPTKLVKRMDSVVGAMMPSSRKPRTGWRDFYMGVP